MKKTIDAITMWNFLASVLIVGRVMLDHLKVNYFLAVFQKFVQLLNRPTIDRELVRNSKSDGRLPLFGKYFNIYRKFHAAIIHTVGSLTRRAWLDPAARQCVKRNTLHAGAILALFCGMASAQQFPTLTYNTVVFNAVTDNLALSPVPTPGTRLSQNTCSTANSKCAIQNTGMGTHMVRVCTAAALAGALNIWMESSLDNTSPPSTWKQISPELVGKVGNAGCADIKACGYYPYVRLHMSNPGGASVTAQYAGIATNCDAAGTVTNQGGAMPVTFNAANLQQGLTLTGLTLVQSTAVRVIPAFAGGIDNVVYAVSVSNPNAVPVFASIQCSNPAATVFQWEIPANDHRPLFDTVVGTYCTFDTLGSCSTSSTAAVDPVNSCLFNVAYKHVVLIHSKVNNAGTTLVSNPVTPN